MNKILTYTIIAILLGAITMAAPLAVLKIKEKTFADKDSFPNDEHNSGAPPRESMFTTKEEQIISASSLFSIGLMIIPGFLIGLGVFVFLKKRIL